MFIFKCAENKEHISKFIVSFEEVHAAAKFFTHFNIPTFMPIPEFLAVCKSNENNMDKIHDMVHMLMDDLVTAYDNKHEVLIDGSFDQIIVELRQKQIECKQGSKHG
jgi:hypothetical protein